jgi:Aldehyde dehydrogenase family
MTPTSTRRYDAAAFGAFMNQGQICMSTERIIVDNKIADAFVAKFAVKASKLPAGDPRGHVVLGSLVDLAPALTMLFLVLEMTRNLDLAAAVRAPCFVTNTLVRATFGHSFSTWRLHLSGETIRSANDVGWLRGLIVSRLMRSVVPNYVLRRRGVVRC